jgi:hypothetical protein
MAIEFDDLTVYYIGLLIIQYVNLPRARETVGVFAREMVADSVALAVRSGFDLETAIGRQLDILAEYRGAKRSVYGVDLGRLYFSFPYATDSSPSGGGFVLAGSEPDSYWLLASGSAATSYSMSDDELRRFVKYLAELHSIEFSVKNIDDLLWAFFGDNVEMTDNENMTLSYVHDAGDTDTLFTIIFGTAKLPKPAGVSISVS